MLEKEGHVCVCVRRRDVATINSHIKTCFFYAFSINSYYRSFITQREWEREKSGFSLGTATLISSRECSGVTLPQNKWKGTRARPATCFATSLRAVLRLLRLFSFDAFLLRLIWEMPTRTSTISWEMLTAIIAICSKRFPSWLINNE